MSLNLGISKEDAEILLNGLSWICSEHNEHHCVANLMTRILGLYPDLGTEYEYVLKRAEQQGWSMTGMGDG